VKRHAARRALPTRPDVAPLPSRSGAPAPRSRRRSLAPLWNRLGAILFRHGEHFYNFQGLRAFKDKFAPAWEPRYLASPGLLALPLVLTRASALISGGVTGVVAR
jgi:phosphatidylglycerol lysyltransferase